MRVPRRMEGQCTPTVLNGFIEVRQNALLLEPVLKAISEVIKSHVSIRMTRGTLLQGRSMLLHIIRHTPIAIIKG